jgi:hypothetical protein
MTQNEKTNALLFDIVLQLEKIANTLSKLESTSQVKIKKPGKGFNIVKHKPGDYTFYIQGHEWSIKQHSSNYAYTWRAEFISGDNPPIIHHHKAMSKGDILNTLKSLYK